MSSSTSLKKNDFKLTPKTKEIDRIACKKCGKGIYIPVNPNAVINHGFTCNNCGSHVNFDFADVIVD